MPGMCGKIGETNKQTLDDEFHIFFTLQCFVVHCLVTPLQSIHGTLEAFWS